MEEVILLLLDKDSQIFQDNLFNLIIAMTKYFYLATSMTV